MLAHVGQMLGHVGKRWDHIWYWAYLEPFWANIGLMLSHFGLCVGLYLVSVSLSFGSMQGVCKEYSKHKEKQHVLAVQYQTILHTCGPWHLQRFSCPGRHDLDKEKAASVACDKVNKCKISSKKREWQPKQLCIFQGKRDFSCAFSIWLNGWRFYANASASSGSRQAKVQVTST